MRFEGWWVSGGPQGVNIIPAGFDETDLSEASGWKEAHQNEDPELPHGFVDLDRALANAGQRLGETR